MPSAKFRAGVVAVVSNSRGELLAFERSDVPGAWQLPQGGIDVGESPQDAAWRELGEETGLSSREVELVGEHPSWVAYEFPDHVRSEGRRLGQVQRWYFFRVVDDEVTPTPDEIDSQSLMPQLKDPAAAGDAALSYHGKGRSLRTDTHRLIVHRSGEAELYDHRTPEGETRNIAKEHQEMVEALRSKIEERFEP